LGQNKKPYATIGRAYIEIMGFK
jgi:hypothetical protein